MWRSTLTGWRRTLDLDKSSLFDQLWSDVEIMLAFRSCLVPVSPPPTSVCGRRWLGSPVFLYTKVRWLSLWTFSDAGIRSCSSLCLIWGHLTDLIIARWHLPSESETKPVRPSELNIAALKPTCSHTCKGYVNTNSPCLPAKSHVQAERDTLYSLKDSPFTPAKANMR